MGSIQELKQGAQALSFSCSLFRLSFLLCWLASFSSRLSPYTCPRGPHQLQIFRDLSVQNPKRRGYLFPNHFRKSPGGGFDGSISKIVPIFVPITKTRKDMSLSLLLEPKNRVNLIWATWAKNWVP